MRVRKYVYIHESMQIKVCLWKLYLYDQSTIFIEKKAVTVK